LKTDALQYAIRISGAAYTVPPGEPLYGAGQITVGSATAAEKMEAANDELREVGLEAWAKKEKVRERHTKTPKEIAVEPVTAIAPSRQHSQTSAKKLQSTQHPQYQKRKEAKPAIGFEEQTREGGVKNGQWKPLDFFAQLFFFFFFFFWGGGGGGLFF